MCTLLVLQRRSLRLMITTSRSRRSGMTLKPMPGMPWWKKLLGPLRSRKGRIAIATILGVILAEWKIDVSMEVVLAIVGVGATLILSIAHEDHGRHIANGNGKTPDGKDSP